MIPVAVVLDLRDSAVKPRVMTFRVELTPDHEGELMRAVGCPQHNLTDALAGIIEASLSTILQTGRRGLLTDRMIERGDIEVGRSAKQ